METTLGVVITISLFIFALGLATNFRMTMFAASLLVCAPFIIAERVLKFAIQILSWFVDRQARQGRYTILFKAVTTFTYWFYLVHDTFVEEFNRIITILTGEESMAIQIVRPGTPEVFIPSCEDEKDANATRISMTKLSATRRAKIRDGVVGLKKGKVNKFRSNLVALQLVLEQMSGWENVYDGEKAVEFDTEDPINSFDVLPTEVQEELLDQYGSAAAEEEEEEVFEDEEEDEDIFA